MKESLLTITDEFMQIMHKGKQYKKYKCLCQCGNICWTTKRKYETKHTKSCGCLAKSYIKFLGTKIGQLTLTHIHSYSPIIISTVCECGRTSLKHWSVLCKSIRDENNVSCGCLTRRTMNPMLLSDINNPNNQYIYGLLMADGCITDNNTIRLFLKESDRDIIDLINKYIGSKLEPIIVNTKKNPKDSFNNIQNLCGIAIQSKELCQFLASIGITARKTGKEQIHPCLTNSFHFWRGMIDGDGFLPINKKYIAKIGLCGSLNVIKSFIKFVNKNIITTSAKPCIVKRVSFPFGEMVFTRKRAYVILLKLYKEIDDDCLFLKSKRDIALKMITTHEAGTRFKWATTIKTVKQ